MRFGVSCGPAIEQLEDMPEDFDFAEIAIGEMEVSLEELDTEFLEEQLEENGYDLIVHLPFRQPLATLAGGIDSANLEYLESLLEFSAELGAEKAVVHVNIRYGEEKEAVEEKARENIRMLMEKGRKHGVEVVFEHIPFDDSKLCDLEEFGELMEELDAPICFDTGHAYAETDQEGVNEFLEEHLGQISHFHLQDSMGGDDHVSIGHGEIDWEEVGSRVSGFDGTATFEIFTDEPRYFEVSREIFLENLGN